MNKIKKQIRTLSGNDVKVLLVIRLIGGFDVGNKKIKAWTKLSFPTIANCLENLHIEGLITQTKRTNGWQLTAFGSKVLLGKTSQRLLHSPHSSSSVLIDSKDINIKDINTTTIEPSKRKFDSPTEIVSYLKEKGVWDNQIDVIAKIAGSDLGFLESYFETLECRLAIYRIKNDIPPDEPELTREQKWGLCGGWVCEKNPCECDIE